MGSCTNNRKQNPRIKMKCRNCKNKIIENREKESLHLLELCSEECLEDQLKIDSKVVAEAIRLYLISPLILTILEGGRRAEVAEELLKLMIE